MNILIVEDMLFAREVLRKIAIAECRFDSVREAGTVVAALEHIQQCRPDVILLDIGLPDGDGFLVADAAARIVPPSRILVISAHINEYILAGCEKFRVHGFIDKNTEMVAMVTSALVAVAQGKTYFSTAFETARRIWHHNPCTIAKRLSNTEQRVLSLIARGLSDEEIAEHLTMARKTAGHHRTNILRRLGAPGTPKLIVSAIGSGFGKID